MHHQIQHPVSLYFPQRVCYDFLMILGVNSDYFLSKINRLVFIMEKCVEMAVFWVVTLCSLVVYTRF